MPGYLTQMGNELTSGKRVPDSSRAYIRNNEYHTNILAVTTEGI